MYFATQDLQPSPEVADELPSALSDVLRLSQPATDFFRQVYCILGLPIDAVTIDQAIDRLRVAAGQNKRCFLSTPNLNFLVASREDASFRDSVLRSDISVADGMPLVWLARLMGIPLHERVAGSTMLERMSQDLKTSLTVYFFGGPEGAAAQAAYAFNSRSGGMRCVGYQSPGYGTVDEMSCSHMIQNINSCRPDFLVVAMGAKKGQAWIERNYHQIKAPIVSHLGAVVNFFAGTISRAPVWMQKSGLEWLWRIKEEPVLWKRYFHDGMALIRLVFEKVLPCLFLQRCAMLARKNAAHADVTIEHVGCGARLTLAGSWCEGNMQALRKAFTEAVLIPSDIVLDVRRMDYADSACLGLFALLYGHQSKIGHELRFEGLSESMRRIFRVHCVDYLATNGQHRLTY